jgi:hypothetical protein
MQQSACRSCGFAKKGTAVKVVLADDEQEMLDLKALQERGTNICQALQVALQARTIAKLCNWHCNVNRHCTYSFRNLMNHNLICRLCRSKLIFAVRTAQNTKLYTHLPYIASLVYS